MYLIKSLCRSKKNIIIKKEGGLNQKKNTLKLELPDDFVKRADGKISLFDFYFIVKKKFSFILILSFIIIFLTIMHLQFIYRPVYTSFATIIPVNNENSANKIAGIAATFGISVPSSGSGAKMIYPEIVKSKTIAKKNII